MNILKISPRLAAVIAASIIIVFLAIGSLNALRFHMVSTSPGLSSVGSATPYIDFKFNKNLSSSYSVTSNPLIIKSSEVEGKTIRLFLDSNQIVVGSKYQLIIESISSKVGDKIINKNYKFTAKDVQYNDLSAAQKSYVVSKQDNFVYTSKTILLTGDNELINRGVSNSQLVVLQQAVFAYSKTINKQFDSVSINSISVVQSPYDSSSANPSNILDFDGIIDGQSYHFKLTASGFTSAQLQIYDKSGGTQLFDSGLKEPLSS